MSSISHINLLLAFQHSPTISTIHHYDPEGYTSDNLMSVANKARVLRFQNKLFELNCEQMKQFINQIQFSKSLLFLFLRRLVSPIYDHELQSAILHERQISRLEMLAISLEDLNLWHFKAQQLGPLLQSFISCSNFSQFQHHLTEIYKALSINSSDSFFSSITPSQCQETSTNLEWAYVSTYKINSKKKSLQTRPSPFIEFEKQQAYVKSLPKFSSFKDLFAHFNQHFNLKIEEECTQIGQKWEAQVQYKHILVKKQAASKVTSALDAEINMFKVLAPSALEQIYAISATNYQQLLSTCGKLQIRDKSKPQNPLLTEDQILKDTPFDYQKVDDYLAPLNNVKTKAIRKYQNSIIQYLCQKFKTLQIQQKIESVGPMFVLETQIQDQKHQMQLKKIFQVLQNEKQNIWARSDVCLSLLDQLNQQIYIRLTIQQFK